MGVAKKAGRRPSVPYPRGIFRRIYLQYPKRKILKRQTVEDMNEQQVRNRLQLAVSNRNDVVKLVRDILSGIGNSSLSQDSVRREVFLFCVKQLNSDFFSTSESKELIGVLLVEVSSLEGPTLVEIIEELIEDIKKGSLANGISLELVPKILEVIKSKSVIIIKRGESLIPSKMDGLDWKSHLISSLFGCRWSPSSVSHVANMCRDIILLPDELQQLIEKLLRVMKTLNHQELPPLVHQLLMLSSKGHRTLVLEGLLNLFNQFDKEIQAKENGVDNGDDDVMEIGHSRDELYTTEGTVLLHMNFALKQNQELRKEFFKGLKNSQTHLASLYVTPFSIALSLSLTNMSRLTDTIFDYLKAIIIKTFKQEEQNRTSFLIRELSEVVPFPDINTVFLDVVEHSVFGWDYVIQGLFSFAVQLMDTYTPKNSSCTLKGTPQMKACTLGGRILLNCFKCHSIVRQEVLSQLINRILSNAPSSCVEHYICVLAEVARSVPQVVLEGSSQLKDSFSYINCIPSIPAVNLIQAILPLVQYKSAVRDALLLVMRKFLFSRQLECRKTAVGGYLLLLKNFKVLDSSSVHNGDTGGCSDDSHTSQYSYSSQSQTYVEVHISRDSSSMTRNEALCLEILGILKRSLTQQDEIKLNLYEGLYDVLCTNTKLAKPVLEFLLNQFDRFYEPEDSVLPPVKLGLCVTSSTGCDSVRTEPFAHLVCCIQRCVRKYNEWADEEIDSTCLQEAQKILLSLTQRLSRTDLDDFELDRSCDYSLSSSVGLKNNITARIIMGLYETLMDYTFNIGDYSQESCDTVIKLYNGYQCIHDIIQDKGGLKQPCLLPLISVVSLLTAVFSDMIPSHQMSLTKLRESVPFVKYIISITLIKIQQIGDQASPWEWGSRSHSSLNRKNFQSACSIGKVLFSQLDGTSIQKESGKKEKGKPVHVMCLEGFSQLCHVIITCYHDKIIQFLSMVGECQSKGSDDDMETDSEENRNEQIYFFIRHFQRLIVSILNGSLKSYSLKDIPHMITIISILTVQLDTDCTQIEEVYEWILSQCKEQAIDDNAVVKVLVSLLLTLNYRIKGTLKIVKKISQDIHYHIGDIDEDIQLSGRSNFTIVDNHTAIGSILALLCHHLDLYLTDSTVILKTEPLVSSENSIASSSQSERLCCSLCDRMVQLVISFHELVQTAIPPGPLNETVIKVLTKLYTIMTEIAKYQLSLYNLVSVILPQFKKLIDNVGTCLSQQIYTFIMHIQGMPQEQTNSKKGKGKSHHPLTSQVRKETKSIPNLIYSMEQLEIILIKISKKSRINFMDTFKRSVARDFRIQDQALEAILNEQEDEDEEEEDEIKEEGNGDSSPVRKKLKKT